MKAERIKRIIKILHGNSALLLKPTSQRASALGLFRKELYFRKTL